MPLWLSGVLAYCRKILSKDQPIVLPAAAMLSSSAALQDIPQAGKTAQPGKVWNSAKLQTRN